MRVVRALIAIASVVAVTAGSAQAAKSPLIQLRWHTVARGVTSVTATDRYLAYSTANGLTLIDRHTGARSALPASECPFPAFDLFFGGPWMGGCPDPQAQAPYTRLYNIPGRYWLTVPAPASCGPDNDTSLAAGVAACRPIAVGSQWIKLETFEPECLSHCGLNGALLQNIRTGEAARDPVGPGGQIRENLDSSTGTSPLCPPLRYPAVYDSDTRQLGPGDLTMLGQFALSLGFVQRLEQCHSDWRLRIFGQPIIAGSQLVLWTDSWWRSKGHPNHGLLLPSRRQFNFYVPRRFEPGRYQTVAVALSGRVIYVLTSSNTLWAATAPRLG